MRCDDGHFYVVKFQNNPQHVRVLANELLGTRIAARLGLPVPVVDVVSVGEWLIAHTAELKIELAGKSLPCAAGLQFAARFVADPFEGQVFDYLPQAMLPRVRNLEDFAGILAFDKWTCNANGRQAVFWRKARERKYTASFVDQGYCFNAGEWSFPDAPLRGVYGWNDVYAGITGWGSFEPWLGRIEEFKAEDFNACAADIPTEWGVGWDDLEQLREQLLARRGRVKELIAAFRFTTRQPFVNWKEGADSNQPTAISPAAVCADC